MRSVRGMCVAPLNITEVCVRAPMLSWTSVSPAPPNSKNTGVSMVIIWVCGAPPQPTHCKRLTERAFNRYPVPECEIGMARESGKKGARLRILLRPRLMGPHRSKQAKQQARHGSPHWGENGRFRTGNGAHESRFGWLSLDQSTI